MWTQMHLKKLEYNWKQNKGYGTKEHIEKIKINGLSKYHKVK